MSFIYSFDFVQDFVRTGVNVTVDVSGFSVEQVIDLVDTATECGAEITLRNLHKFDREEIRSFVKASHGEEKTGKLRLDLV